MPEIVVNRAGVFRVGFLSETSVQDFDVTRPDMVQINAIRREAVS